MRKVLQKLLLRRGYNISAVTPQPKLEAFLARLHPVTTDKPLIRIGDSGDGAYLVPDDLEGIEACYSPGVDVTASFERALTARGIPCFLADASVESAPIAGPLIDFEPKFVGAKETADMFSLDAWVTAKTPDHGDALLLQMDIEGAEWPVLLNISERLLRSFRIIVLELHDVDRMFERYGFMIMQTALDRLLQHFHVVHIHPNNAADSVSNGHVDIPRLLEVSFIRKDRVTVTGYAEAFPHPLDIVNRPASSALVLPRSLHH